MLLTCAMAATQPIPALAKVNIVQNINLSEASAKSFAGAPGPERLQFAGDAPGQVGWIVTLQTNDVTEPQFMVGRVRPSGNAERPYAMRWGLAARGADGRLTFTERMRGLCKLVAPEELK